MNHLGKELRLSFAMGGGVSLGVFSGAALTEAIKLAILRGKDTEGKLYRKVTLDVFSGASAGALSLAIMIRFLTQHTSEARKKALANLKILFNGDEDFAALLQKAEEDKNSQQLEVAEATDYRNNNNRLQDLISAQVVQDIQNEIWAKKIKIDQLLALDKDPDHLRYTASVLDRKALEDLAAEYFSFENLLETKSRRILAKRIIFACTLTNITPLLLRSNRKNIFNNFAMADIAPKTHRDMRIFDVFFEKLSKQDLEKKGSLFPDRWVRYHKGEKIPFVKEIDTKEVLYDVENIASIDSWKTITATVLACGAFPFAFEPVVLNRKEHEFGDFWKKFGLEKESQYPFSYVDGGVINNEPVREAFRLSSFIDAHKQGEFERRVIFVDPRISNIKTSFEVPIHQKYILQKPNFILDGYDPEQKDTLSRLVPQIKSILKTIIDESQVRELDEVDKVVDKFRLRDNARKILKTAQISAFQRDQITEIKNWCEQILQLNKKNEWIPPNTLDIQGEVLRVASEEDVFSNISINEILSCLNDPASASEKNAKLTYKILLFVALDLLMNLEGKHSKSFLVAIAPSKNPSSGNVEDIIELPGGKLVGFGGFMSNVPGEYEIKLARYCSKKAMEASQLIKTSNNNIPPAPEPLDRLSEDDEKIYKKEFTEGLEKLLSRLSYIVKQTTFFNIFPGINMAALSFVASILTDELKKLLEKTNAKPYNFWVIIDDAELAKKIELDGAGFTDQDVPPLFIDGKAILVTFANHNSEKNTWDGPHVKENILEIDKDRFGPLPDKLFCSIVLPDSNLIQKASLFPNPIFKITISPSDEDKQKISMDKWLIDPGVTPLEKNIF